jgi:P-type conjugative transfer ATPase TrbB
MTAMVKLIRLTGSQEAIQRRRQMLQTAFGAEIAQALADPSVIEVMVNPDGKLWVDQIPEGRSDTGETISTSETERIIRLIASQTRREVHAGAPILSAELPETGERFEGLIPPVAPAPCFSIRKPAQTVFQLADYVASRVLSASQAEALIEAIHQRQNVVIVGGTSSGKTTLVNALLAEVATMGERVLILEDTRELRCAAPDCVRLRTKPGVASLADLVRSTLRLRPDRIIVGDAVNVTDLRFQDMGGGGRAVRHMPATVPEQQRRLLLRARERDAEILLLADPKRVPAQIGDKLANLLLIHCPCIDGPGLCRLNPFRQELQRPNAIPPNLRQQAMRILPARSDALRDQAADADIVGQEILEHGDDGFADEAVFLQGQGQGDRDCFVPAKPVRIILEIHRAAALAAKAAEESAVQIDIERRAGRAARH